MVCSLPGSSVHGILQAGILEQVAIYFSADLPDPGIKLTSLALQADSLPSEPQGRTTCSKVMHKILQARLQKYMKQKLPDGSWI